jgi:hypothetical protein
MLLPLTLSLSDFGIYFIRWRAGAPNFLFSDFLFSDNAAPATHGRQPVVPPRSALMVMVIVNLFTRLTSQQIYIVFPVSTGQQPVAVL